MEKGAERKRNGRALGWLAALGVAVLVALVALPTLSGAASAAPAFAPATASGSVQWAYGGEGWSNNSLQLGNATATWDAQFGWTVIFTATNTTPGTVALEEQRTVGITITSTWSGPVVQLKYTYHAQEVDTAFANVTDLATVYSNGSPLPALGIDNASVAIAGAISQAVSETAHGMTRSASLDVTGTASANVAFAPALGLIPLNLTGVDQWNSTSQATGAAAWNLSYSWTEQGYNGTTGSGSGSHTGNLTVAGPVSVTGYLVHAELPVFNDHKPRIGVVLIVSGPFDAYDGFVLVPHAFDLFGTASHPYDSMSFGSASIASGETLYVSQTPSGLGVTAASSSFAGSDGAVNAMATPTGPSAPAASPAGPGATVTGEPMSVAQAESENNCLTSGCAASGGAGGNGLLLVAVVGLVVAAVVGTVGVVEWRSYARRRSQKGLVGGYGESWSNGVPPAGSVPGSAQPPAAPASGPSAPQEPFGPR
jgi:hypothetical protein